MCDRLNLRQIVDTKKNIIGSKFVDHRDLSVDGEGSCIVKALEDLIDIKILQFDNIIGKDSLYDVSPNIVFD